MLLKKNYLFYIPEWQQNSNGIVTLWEAARIFSQKRNTRVIPYAAGKRGKTPETYKFLENKLQEIDPGSDNTVVIYPETIPDNPLGAKNIARYLLAKPLIFGTPSIKYCSNEYYFSFSKIINPYLDQLNITLPGHGTFLHDTSVRRDIRKVAIYYGKVRSRCDFSALPELIRRFRVLQVITRTTPATASELYSLIASSGLLISLDPLSNLCFESTRLGTPVLMADPVFQEGHKEFNFPLHGFFYDSRAVQTINFATFDYSNLKRKVNIEALKSASENQKNCQNIIKIIEQFFSKQSYKNPAIDSTPSFKTMDQLEKYDISFYENEWTNSVIFPGTHKFSLIAFHFLRRLPKLYFFSRLATLPVKKLLRLLFRLEIFITVSQSITTNLFRCQEGSIGRFLHGLLKICVNLFGKISNMYGDKVDKTEVLGGTVNKSQPITSKINVHKQAINSTHNDPRSYSSRLFNRFIKYLWQWHVF